MGLRDLENFKIEKGYRSFLIGGSVKGCDIVQSDVWVHVVDE